MTEQSRIPWGWIGFFGILVLLALLSAAALLLAGRELAEHEVKIRSEPVWRVIVHGEVHLLDEAQFRSFQEKLDEAAGKQLRQLHQDARELIDRKVEALFSPVHAAVPAYGDWYYSLAGEYLRLGHMLTSDILGFMSRQLEARLFEQTNLEEALQQLPMELQSELGARLSRAGRELIDELSASLGEPDSRRWQPGWEIAGELPLERLAGEELMPSRDLVRRQLLGLGMGAGAGALVAKGGGALLVKKMVATVAGGKSFQAAAAMAGKLAAKSLAKGGSALAGAGTGALLCAPGGPLALLCGAVAGVVTWVSVDYLALKLDEAVNREELEAEIHQAIRKEEESLKESLIRLHASWLQQRMESFRQRAAPEGNQSRGYRPIDEVSGLSAGGEPAEAEAPRPATSVPQ